MSEPNSYPLVGRYATRIYSLQLNYGRIERFLCEPCAEQETREYITANIDFSSRPVPVLNASQCDRCVSPHHPPMPDDT